MALAAIAVLRFQVNWVSYTCPLFSGLVFFSTPASTRLVTPSTILKGRIFMNSVVRVYKIFKDNYNFFFHSKNQPAYTHTHNKQTEDKILTCDYIINISFHVTDFQQINKGIFCML